MRRIAIAMCITVLGPLSVVHAEDVAINTSALSLLPQTTKSAQIASEDKISPQEEPFKGWGYLVAKLKQAGVSQEDLEKIYNNPRMPPFSFVPFRLTPKETTGMYKGFISRQQCATGAEFAKRHKVEFDRIEKTLHVPREVITAIVLVESHLGKNTGSALIIERLSRVASVGEPRNLAKNLELVKADSPDVEMSQLESRAQYLERTFLPEIPALIDLSKRNNLDVFDVRGSSAGAFGMPQFLPTTFLRFGVDGDRNGVVSLFDDVDAIWSTGKFLAAFGYRNDLKSREKRAVLWRYNKSDPYIDTILEVSRGIKALLRHNDNTPERNTGKPASKPI
jgi:membrane-bound lytic murein transglycosylase B